MEKFLKIGEQYVQWIALGLGALYLGLMAWFYVAQPPITVTLNRKDYLPGEVDQQIKNVSLRPMLDDITSKTVWADPQPVDPVKELKVAFVDHAPQGPPTTPSPIALGGPPKGPTTGPANPTIVMPPAPIVSTVGVAGGLSQVGMPQPVAAPPANAAAGAAAAAAAAPVQPVIELADRDWLTLPWTVVVKDLDNAFQAANIPNLPNVYQTAFLRIELVRQEVLPNGLLPNGKPAPEFLIPDITTVTLLPMPTEKAPPNPDKLDYLTWAAASAGSILTPPFFGVASGTPWYPPGTPKPNDVFAQAVPQPGAIQPIAPQPAFPPRGLPMGVGPNGVHGVVHGPALPAPAAGPGIMRRPAFAPAIQPGVAPAIMPPGMVQPLAQAGFINPAQAQDITIYTHDWTVEPGHTYHYKMRYTISNPLFGVQTGDVKPPDRDRLAITSPYSDWTAPIEIPSRFRFWVQKFQRNGNNEVTFDLFTKKPSAPGGLERSTIRATPGDSIGPSPWLLVDVRQDSNRHNVYYFLIADPTGHIERHDQEKDKNDPDHLEMLDRTGASAAAIGAP